MINLDIILALIDLILIFIGFLTVYNFLIYPVLLKFLSFIIPAQIQPDLKDKPDITFILAAFNEELLIEEAIKSILNSDYPTAKINIIIGSDGSTDKTNEILSKIAKSNSNIKFVELSRGGKNIVLNTIVPDAQTDIILFMDADVRLNVDTVSNLIKYFSNDNVGGVIASQKVVGDGTTVNAGSEGDSLYHRYEENIRINEAIIDSNVNSLGYLYAIRKEYFIPIPNNFVCDDLHNVYSVLRSKKRMLFACEAKAYEIRPKSLSNEYHRRVRAVAGGWATVVYHKELLNIFQFGITSFFIWSHKIFRWLSPVFMFALVITTIVGFFYNSSLIYIFAIPQLLLYSMALLGFIFEKMRFNISILRLFVFFVSMNYSSLLGLIRFIKKQQNAIWNREGFSD